MKYRLLFTVLMILSFTTALQAQNIPSYSADDLNARTSGKDTIYVVNFWATWCMPCVKELPAFSLIQNLYKTQPVKVILVSFDFKEQYPSKLSAWVTKKKLQPEVVWFNETSPTEYIPKVAPEWEGGLPATLLINNKKGIRLLKPDEITAETLKTWIDQQL